MIQNRIHNIMRRAVHILTENQDAVVLSGIGFGLKFNGGHSNTPYVLGRNERPVQDALATHLRSGYVFFDIGANVGFFTVIGAKLVGDTGQVYAFEPVPANAACVRHNAAINSFKQIAVFECAVSSVDGAGELIVAHHDGGAMLANVGSPPDPQNAIDVELVTIDTLVSSGTIEPPNVVKIDVESAELDVLVGMKTTMKEHRPVIILEIDAGERNQFDRKRRVCSELLLAEGYRLQPLPDSYENTGWLVWHTVATPTKK